MDQLEEEYEKAIQNQDAGGEETLITPGSQGSLSQASSLRPDRLGERQLWVDKYEPTTYFDLLTPETQNANVLTWLRSWDEIVFPERAQALGTGKLTQPSGAQRLFFGKKESFVNSDLTGKAHHSSASTEYSFRNKRLLMLHGPPGTGKSTLAKLLSKQCGYESRHINASDMRSADQLLRSIRNAMTTDSHFNSASSGQTAKPCCIVIDEVDGAAGGGMVSSAASVDGFAPGAKGFAHVIQVLQSCIQYSNTLKGKQKEEGLAELDDEPVAQDSEEDSDQIDSSKPKIEKKAVKKTNKKKNDNLFALNRPIIFICNNLYAKPLRPLREMCLLMKI